MEIVVNGMNRRMSGTIDEPGIELYSIYYAPASVQFSRNLNFWYSCSNKGGWISHLGGQYWCFAQGVADRDEESTNQQCVLHPQQYLQGSSDAQDRTCFTVLCVFWNYAFTIST